MTNLVPRQQPQFLGKVLTRLMLMLLALVYSTLSVADTSVWMVRSGTDTIYLGGTVHLLRPSDYPLPQEFEEAYGNSSHLYFETDISAMNDMATQMALLQELTYSDERTLQSVLNAEAYEALAVHLQSIGMPIMMMDKFKPGMVVSTLQVLEFQKLGFTPQGVDAHFHNRAVSDGKQIGQLETLEEQIQYLANMGAGNESEFILLSLRDLTQISTMMEDLIGAWRQGDADALDALFVEDMREESEDLYDSLLVERNNNWLPVIEALFESAGTEFILVGAAHLVGESGLLKQLQDKGYAVQKI